MTYSLPPIAVTGEIITAAWGNDVRDSLAETAAAKATTAGRGFRATGANAIEEAGGLFHIETVELTANGEFDFTNIPQTYRELQLSLSVRINDLADDDSHLFMRFNGDGGTDQYRWVRMYAAHDDRLWSSHRNRNSMSFSVVGNVSTVPAGFFDTVEIVIPWYARTDRRKYFNTRFVNREGVSNSELWITSGYWQSSSAINRIHLFGDDSDDDSGPDILAGSIASLYGLSA